VPIETPLAVAVETLEDGVELAAGGLVLELALELLLLPHAATSNATPTNAATPLTRKLAPLGLATISLLLVISLDPKVSAGHEHRLRRRPNPSRLAPACDFTGPESLGGS
jgi:hypothetical protein